MGCAQHQHLTGPRRTIFGAPTMNATTHPLKYGIWILSAALWAQTSQALELTFLDPVGDDNGAGTLRYPTSKEYVAGAFDLKSLKIADEGDEVVITVEFAKEITDPWVSKDWGGNGFSLQFVHVYFDLDGKRRQGERRALPGAWVEFEPDSYFEKVVLISPQPNTKISGEVAAKANWLKRRIVLPNRVEVRRQSLVAYVPKNALGTPSHKWGVQAFVLSNEGFAAKEDLLARKVNENEGEHRFGGGCDGFGDAHVVDLLTGTAKAEPSEVKLQHAMLSAFKCAETAQTAQLAKVAVVRLN